MYYAGLPVSGAAVGIEPWVSNGTAAGTQTLLVIIPQAGSNPDAFLDFNGVTYFEADPPSGPRQLWRTDGTAAGTRSVAAITMGSPRLAAGQTLFFARDDGTTGAALWALGNDPPVAVDDDGGSVAAGSSIAISVLANDHDPDGALNPASVAIVTATAHGTTTVSASGVVSYQSTAGYTGSDRFTYAVADDQGYASSPAIVAVKVVARAPASGGGGGGGLDLADCTLLLALAIARRAQWLRGVRSRVTLAAR
ncbi:MAG: cadherin-like domain-containing protein [Proteobacteria bacterium]|nr:cadherin-like domain-containing protein [Pseudomonadota bacterium]